MQLNNIFTSIQLCLLKSYLYNKFKLKCIQPAQILNIYVVGLRYKGHKQDLN